MCVKKVFIGYADIECTKPHIQEETHWISYKYIAQISFIIYILSHLLYFVFIQIFNWSRHV